MGVDEQDAQPGSPEGAGAPARVHARPDAVYGSVRVAAWAADLLATARCRRRRWRTTWGMDHSHTSLSR